MFIRSEPSGAPVWVDEQYVGETPVDWSFAHYGWRRVRIGPVRDENDRLLYLEKQIEVKIDAPWYETFPIDFSSEVLYLGRLVDEHVLPVLELDSAAATPTRYSDEQIEELRQRAQEFREGAMYSIPEAPR